MDGRVVDFFDIEESRHLNNNKKIVSRVIVPIAPWIYVATHTHTAKIDKVKKYV